MAIINVTAVLLCLIVTAYFWKESLVETLPVIVCGLVLVLYVLAMLHHLSWIDALSAAWIAGFVFWLISRKKQERTAFLQFCKTSLLSPSFLSGVFLLVLTGILVSSKVVTWWDDVNFWATDVKSLYFLDGFAGKYGNAAPEFGDYPPGGQLIKWWFLHWNPKVFKEGLAFVGYYVMNLSFLLPLFRKIKGKNVIVWCLFAASLWFFPSIAEVYGYDGFCADLTMACIYGNFLFAVTQRAEKKERVYWIRLGLYLSVLVLIKSVGFIWAAFGILFLLCYSYHYADCDNSKSAWKKGTWKKILPVCIAPLLTGGSWLLFCLLMRRVTKTTATAVKYMTTDEYGISGYTGEFAKAFFKAFVSSPLHKEQSLVLDLTPLGLYVCICLLVIFFFRKHLMPKKEGRLVLWYSVISGAVFYSIIFLAHITIFATETQYLEASGMISSIERYGAPFTIGTLLFLANIWLTHGEVLFAKEKTPLFLQKYGTVLAVIGFVALTAGYRTGYHGLISYRREVPEQLQAREDMLDEGAKLLIEKLQVLPKDESTRVYCIQMDDTPRWVKNSYTNLEAAPVSIIYRSLNLADAEADWIAQEVSASHAEYLYVEEQQKNAAAVFDALTEGETFVCQKLYRIKETDTGLRLYAIE